MPRVQSYLGRILKKRKFQQEIFVVSRKNCIIFLTKHGQCGIMIAESNGNGAA